MKNLVLYIVLWIASLGSVGCLGGRQEPRIVMHADAQFLPEERACVEWSADMWREQTSGLADAKFVWDYNSKDAVSVQKHKDDNVLLRVTGENPVVVEIDNEGEGSLLGLVTHGPPVRMSLVVDRFYQDRSLNKDECHRVSLHELGHVWGIPHISRNPSNIMFPVELPQRTACLKADDLLGFCFENDCGNIEMHPCPDQPVETF
jgi:hypothetical protein